MLKKRYLTAAGILVLAMACAGCGKPDSGTVIDATPTPTAAAEVTPTKAAQDVIDMQETVEETNVMGDKTTTASKLTIVNRTGSDIAAFYVREHPSDDEEDSEEWGDDLINGSFTLKNTDTAVYYYEKGTTAATYDIRITYTDADKNECFFRDLPMTTMKQITLRMNGTGDDSFPYATYTTTTGTTEYSTLSAVKKRLGLSDDEEDTSSEDPTPTPEADSDNNSDADPTSTPTPSDNSSDSGDDPSELPSSGDKSTAEEYIGFTIDDLQSTIGDAEMSEYDNDEEQGTTGHYYYSGFTVSTAVDEDGNEIVTGVW